MVIINPILSLVSLSTTVVNKIDSPQLLHHDLHKKLAIVIFIADPAIQCLWPTIKTWLSMDLNKLVLSTSKYVRSMATVRQKEEQKRLFLGPGTQSIMQTRKQSNLLFGLLNNCTITHFRDFSISPYCVIVLSFNKLNKKILWILACITSRELGPRKIGFCSDFLFS